MSDTTRRGVGRPRLAPDGLEAHTVTVTPEQWAWLNRDGNASAEVRRILEAEMEATARRQFGYEEVDSVISTDLRLEVEQARLDGLTVEMYRVIFYDAIGRQDPVTAEAVRIGGDRTGIAWGADATWAESNGGDIERDIDMWLNDNEEWESRN